MGWYENDADEKKWAGLDPYPYNRYSPPPPPAAYTPPYTPPAPPTYTPPYTPPLADLSCGNGTPAPVYRSSYSGRSDSTGFGVVLLLIFACGIGLVVAWPHLSKYVPHAPDAAVEGVPRPPVRVPQKLNVEPPPAPSAPAAQAEGTNAAMQPAEQEESAAVATEEPERTNAEAESEAEKHLLRVFQACPEMPVENLYAYEVRTRQYVELARPLKVEVAGLDVSGVSATDAWAGTALASSPTGSRRMLAGGQTQSSWSADSTPVSVHLRKTTAGEWVPDGHLMQASCSEMMALVNTVPPPMPEEHNENGLPLTPGASRKPYRRPGSPSAVEQIFK